MKQADQHLSYSLYVLTQMTDSLQQTQLKQNFD